MTTSDLKLVGYFPKDTAVPPDWSAAVHVKEICSVSSCVNASPPGCFEHGLNNEWGFFNTPEDAAMVAATGNGKYTIFGYRVLPVRYAKGGAKPFVIPELPVEPLGPGFTSLGFDVASKSKHAFVECSPLSCNLIAAEIAVNQFCLIDEFHQAVAFAERCGREQPEPGTYYVLEVLRESPAG